MENANGTFDEYTKALSDNTIWELAIKTLLDRYITARKSVTHEMMNLDMRKWDDILRSNDTKTFWQYVDWKGNCKGRKVLNTPSIEEIEIIMEIKSDVNIPVLDESINENEIKVAWRTMKKKRV